MIKAVIFDLDDTLVTTRVVKWEQHKAVAREFYGRETTDEKLLEHWGKPFDTLINLLHDGVDTIENLHAAYAATSHRFPKEVQKDTLCTVDRLLNNGIQLGIVTATNRNFLLKDLERLGFPHERFFCLQGADETDVHKPDPRVFDPILGALQRTGISKDETMYVGDALTDWYAARDAGLHFIGVTTGLNSADEFKAAGAPKVIERLSELPAIIS
jgi:HAD superfamily hydrolase (TIGR01549 family)